MAEFKDLLELAKRIKDKKLQKLVIDTLKQTNKKLSNPNFKYPGADFKTAPASIAFHHTQEKGLVELQWLAGETALDGKFPMNSSGGLKSKGHPVGATGVAQVVEVFKQLTGKAENGRQIPNNPKVGMTQNMGGSGGSSVVHIMEVA